MRATSLSISGPPITSAASSQWKGDAHRSCCQHPSRKSKQLDGAPNRLQEAGLRHKCCVAQFLIRFMCMECSGKGVDLWSGWRDARSGEVVSDSTLPSDQLRPG